MTFDSILEVISNQTNRQDKLLNIKSSDGHYIINQYKIEKGGENIT